MKISIKNPSSPGASFTNNTNKVICDCYEWITENEEKVDTFQHLRKSAAKDKGFNDNNARNIFPLLKKCGMVSYEQNGEMKYSSLFTNTGKAYVKVLEAEKLLTSDQYTDQTRNEAYNKLENIRQEIIFDGLIRLVNDEDCNYIEEMKSFLKYIKEYEKINKQEFAYLLYTMQNNVLFEKNIVESYRNDNLAIDVEVDVQNDREMRASSGYERRKEDLGFLTAYTYYSSLFKQAGLVYEANKYIYLNYEAKTRIEQFLNGGHI